MKTKPILALMAFTLLGVSCAETIEMDPMEEMPLVVQCVLTRDIDRYLEYDLYKDIHGNDFPGMDYKVLPTQYLDLYYCRRPSESGYEKVSDAEVKITGGGDEYVFAWNGDRWECDFLPRYNTQYKLDVVTAKGDTLSARTSFPSSLVLHGFRPAVYNEREGWGTAGNVKLPAVRDNLFFSFFKYTYWWKEEQPRNYWLQTGFDSAPVSGVFWITVEKDGKQVASLGTNHPDADVFNVTGTQWKELEYPAGFREHLYTDAQDKAAAEAWWNTYSEYSSSSPVFKDFIRINQSSTTKTSVPAGLVDPDFTGIYISDSWKIDPSRTFTLSPGTEYDLEYLYKLVLKVRNVSYDYDKYLRDMADRNLIHGDEFVNIYNPDRVYTNVEGGFGIFGAQCIQTYGLVSSIWY